METVPATALTEMAIFAQVVEQQGFSAAAAALGLSKATVSKQVARLEERLGVRLLHRTTRKLGLTEAGRLFYEHCARMLDEAQEAQRAVGKLQSEPAGVLRVSSPVTFGQRFLASALAEFMRRYPEVRVDMELSDRLVDIIAEGYDVAVRISRLPDSSLIARKLAPMKRVVCASPAYLERHGEPRRPQDLAQHNCLLYSYERSGGRWQLRGHRGPVSVGVSGSLRVNNGDVLRQAALAGIGIAFLPSFIVAGDLRAGRLKMLLEGWSEEETGVYAVFSHRRHLSQKVRVFIDFLSARFVDYSEQDGEAP